MIVISGGKYSSGMWIKWNALVGDNWLFFNITISISIHQLFIWGEYKLTK